MSTIYRKTKTVCTLGPATASPESIRELIQAGMDVARLNFSHGDHDTHRQIISTIRHLSRELGKEVGILQDLRGPKIRLGQLPTPERLLRTDESVLLSSSDISDPDTLPIQYPHLLEDVAVGDRILLADGTIELVVRGKSSDHLVGRVLVGGVIQSHKGVNLPSSTLRVPAFTKKDQADLAVGLKEEVDFVALSFVRHEKDLEPVRQILDQQNYRPLLIAKIERPQALERLGAILDRVDGVMVARGDLGVEMPLEEVPLIQKRVIHHARKAGKPVITATQMLRSMVNSPRPTRAEATDVANAILDGTDAVMLSEETAVGKYPKEAVQVIDRIARATEPNVEELTFMEERLSEALPSTEAAVSRSACWLARDLKAVAIVASTSSGSTARLVSRFRPSRPVVGLTPNLRTQRQLTLSWGVLPVLVSTTEDTDEMFSAATSWILESKIAQAGDRIILTAGIPLAVTGTTNLLRVVELA